MPELIDRQALKNHLSQAQAEAFKRSEWYVAGSIQSFIDLLDKQPTIEPEVRHGRWKCIGEYEEFSEEMADYFCESCGYVISRLKNQKPKFCEGCGARMSAAKEEEGENERA